MIQKKQTRLISAALVAALLGPILGVATQRAVQRRDDRKLLERFGEEVAETVRQLELEFGEGRRTVVAAAALLSTGEATTSNDFSRFAVELMARGSVLQALSWAPLVPLDERRRHEAEARRERGASYGITERGAAGALVPAAERERYFPVRFIQPVAGNETAIGFDLGSDPVRLSMLKLSAETGQPTISGLIRLVQETGVSMGFLLAVPVFRAAAGGDGARSLAGFATGVFRVEDLIAGAFPSRGAGGSEDMNVELVDHDGLSTNASAPLAAGVVVRRALVLDHQTWMLAATPTPGYFARAARSPSVAIGLGATLAWELLLALALTTHRWWFEKARREQAEFAKSVIHSVSEGVMVADTRGRMTIVNEAAQRVLGRGPLNRPLAEWSKAFGLFLPGTNEYFPAEQLPLPRAMRGEHVPETEVYVRNAQVPTGAWTSVTGAPLRDAAGRRLGGVVVFRDVTDQKRAQELSQRLSSAVEQAADSVFITDRTGVIEYVNPAFEATTGYSRAEAVGRTPTLLKSGVQPPEYYATLWATLTGGRPFKGTVVNRRKSGEHFVAEQTITPMRDLTSGEITHFVSVMRDMTERIMLRERELEMRLGRSVQQRLFPQAPPLVEGYDIAGAVTPASATCGDYYDFIPLPDGRLAVIVADVSGHGVGSALIMTALRAYLRSLTTTLTSLDRLAGELNRLLLADLEEQRFVTMILAVLDEKSGTLNWANFGHPSGYVLDRSGEVKAELRSGCRPLGLFADLTCSGAAPVSLDPGDALVFFTDGILESASPEGREFGTAAALDVLRAARDRSAHEIADGLIAASRAFASGGPQDDDLTVVVCKREIQG